MLASLFGYDPAEEAKLLIELLHADPSMVMRSALVLAVFTVVVCSLLQTLCIHFGALLLLGRIGIPTHPVKAAHEISGPRWLGVTILMIWVLYSWGIVIKLDTGSRLLQLGVLIAALRDILDNAFHCFQADDPADAAAVEPLEETIDQLIEAIRDRHIRRLQSGQCTIQMGFVLNDLLTNCERVSDHCSNIAVSVIQEHDGGLDSHTYLHSVKTASSFDEDLRRDLRKYRLPEES